MFDQNLLVGLVVLAVVVLGVYSYAPRLRLWMSGSGSGVEGFAAAAAPSGSMVVGRDANARPLSGQSDSSQAGDSRVASAAPAAPAAGVGGGDYARYNADDSLGALPMAGASKPQGCYPREQINPSELLPKDMNSQWAQANPTGAGDIQGKNFLSAGALIGVNTIGQSLRNATLQLRAEPPNPQLPPGPWNIPTIQPDLQRRPLE